MSQYQTPITITQGGTQIIVGSGGTLVVQSGGSIQNAGGQSLSGGVSLTGAVSITGPINLGGTVAKWAFGTAALTSGVGTIGLPGFTRVLTATASPILGEAPGLGSFTTVMVDLSLAASGSIIFHAGAGTLPYSNNGTVSWHAFGT